MSTWCSSCSCHIIIYIFHNSNVKIFLIKKHSLIRLFYFQVSTESIKDSPPSCPEDKPAVSADLVPPVEVDSNDDKIGNRDDDDGDIEEIFDDEDEEDDGEGEELDLEDEDEIEEDQDEKAVIVPKKPEEKIVTNDTPIKPSVPATKTEEVKAPVVVPKPKDEIKKPEPPKAPEEISEKPKVDIDNAKKSETPAKLKPEFEKGEREGAAAKAAAPEKDEFKSKSEFEIVEREDRDALPPKPAKTEFEVVERGTAVKPVLPPPPPPPSSSTAVVKDDPSRPSVKAGGDDKDALKPVAPEKAATHVKFQEDDDKTTGKGRTPAADFATLEKGETAVKPPGATTTGQNAAVGDFLSAEQAHGDQLLKSHHESIQDQQL